MGEEGRRSVVAGAFSVIPPSDVTLQNHCPSRLWHATVKGDAGVAAGANHARLLGESAVWKLVIYGGDVLGQDNPESPGSGGASPYLRLTLPLRFALVVTPCSALSWKVF
jgi:hypothetical protein